MSQVEPGIAVTPTLLLWLGMWACNTQQYYTHSSMLQTQITICTIWYVP